MRRILRYELVMGSTKPKTITLAVPTIGRFDEVRDTIEAILSGSLLPDEILVSDQNVPSRPDLDEYLRDRSPLIRHLRTEPKGVVFNMNTLLREAKGDILLYIDDDVVPSPDLVRAHATNYESGDTVAVAGRVEQPTGDLPPESVGVVGSFSPWSGRMVFRFNGLRRQECVFAQGANMSFDRKALLSIGGFDEGFIGNGYFFETEGTLRLARAYPHRMVFDPAATLKHLAAPRGGARVQDRAMLNAFYVHNAIRFYRRHSPKPSVPFLAAKLFAESLLKSIYRRSGRVFFVASAFLKRALAQDPKIQNSGLGKERINASG